MAVVVVVVVVVVLVVLVAVGGGTESPHYSTCRGCPQFPRVVVADSTLKTWHV